MMRNPLRQLALLALLGIPLAGLAEERNGLPAHSPAVSVSADRIIVRWSKPTAGVAGRSEKLARMKVFNGARQQIDVDTEVVELSQRLEGTALTAALEQLRADPEVVYASPDLRRHPHSVTSDPLLTSQWYLSNAQPSATRTDAAWDMTTSRANIVVAVLDTGVRFEHPDLGRTASGGKLLSGYDFISNAAVANDGDGRDADPSDPGDWIDASDRTQSVFSDCDPSPSSWHGTRVAGLIGAMTNNAVGVAGAAFDSRILPVRVMGKCGGFDSDIIAAMRWAAGLSVSGAPANPTPAAVINLSLGGTGSCTAAYQNAVDDIIARGVVIVASAGNEGGPVDAPANCAGVLGVAGIRHVGTKVGFSNLGSAIGISAPGGNCVNTGPGQPCLFSIVVAVDSGTTVPLSSTYTDAFNYNVGTSFSAPQAAAAAALMRSVNAHLDPSQLIQRLKETATAFPAADSNLPTCHSPLDASDLQTSECNCTTTVCGAGMLNTGEAVAAARKPFAVLKTTGDVTSDSTISLDATDSFAADGHVLTSYAWSIDNVTGVAPLIASPAQPTTTLQLKGAASFTLKLTIGDESGSQDSVQHALSTPSQPATPAAPPARSGGGGGGSTGWELLPMAILWRYEKRRSKTTRR